MDVEALKKLNKNKKAVKKLGRYSANFCTTILLKTSNIAFEIPIAGCVKNTILWDGKLRKVHSCSR
jgi:hypothetical protein